MSTLHIQDDCYKLLTKISPEEYAKYLDEVCDQEVIYAFYAIGRQPKEVQKVYEKIFIEQIKKREFGDGISMDELY